MCSDYVLAALISKSLSGVNPSLDNGATTSTGNIVAPTIDLTGSNENVTAKTRIIPDQGLPRYFVTLESAIINQGKDIRIEQEPTKRTQLDQAYQDISLSSTSEVVVDSHSKEAMRTAEDREVVDILLQNVVSQVDAYNDIPSPVFGITPTSKAKVSNPVVEPQRLVITSMNVLGNADDSLNLKEVVVSPSSNLITSNPPFLDPSIATSSFPLDDEMLETAPGEVDMSDIPTSNSRRIKRGMKEDLRGTKVITPTEEEETVERQKRKRTKFTQEEKDMLEAFYLDSVYTGRKRRTTEIQKVLSLSKQTINTWFRNRRCKEKRQELETNLKKASKIEKDLRENKDLKRRASELLLEDYSSSDASSIGNEPQSTRDRKRKPQYHESERSEASFKDLKLKIPNIAMESVVGTPERISADLENDDRSIPRSSTASRSQAQVSIANQKPSTFQGYWEPDCNEELSNSSADIPLTSSLKPESVDLSRTLKEVKREITVIDENVLQQPKDKASNVSVFKPDDIPTRATVKFDEQEIAKELSNLEQTVKQQQKVNILSTAKKKDTGISALTAKLYERLSWGKGTTHDQDNVDRSNDIDCAIKIEKSDDSECKPYSKAMSTNESLTTATECVMSVGGIKSLLTQRSQSPGSSHTCRSFTTNSTSSYNSVCNIGLPSTTLSPSNMNIPASSYLRVSNRLELKPLTLGTSVTTASLTKIIFPDRLRSSDNNIPPDRQFPNKVEGNPSKEKKILSTTPLKSGVGCSVSNDEVLDSSIVAKTMHLLKKSEKLSSSGITKVNEITTIPKLLSLSDLKSKSNLPGKSSTPIHANSTVACTNLQISGSRPSTLPSKSSLVKGVSLTMKDDLLQYPGNDKRQDRENNNANSSNDSTTVAHNNTTNPESVNLISATTSISTSRPIDSTKYAIDSNSSSRQLTLETVNNHASSDQTDISGQQSDEEHSPVFDRSPASIPC